VNDLFFHIHKDLPREGPGDRASTLRAFRRVAAVTRVGSVLDVGCGPGLQTVALASATDAHIVALDTERDYLRRLRISASREAVSERVHTVQGSMFNVPVAAGSVDLVWAEGSIYIIGFERGLREWRRLVKPGGCVAVTHLSWLAIDVPDEPRRFWARHFPAMASVNDNVGVAQQCGYELIEHFTLPKSAWWNDYYRPLESRLSDLRTRFGGDSEALGVIDETQEQIDLYRRFADCYGYVFYVLRA
jgi:SAM-dependent methyltransferase